MLRIAAKKVLSLFPPNVQQLVHDKYKETKARHLQRELKAVGAGDLPVLDINHLLHHLRGQALQGLPKQVPHFVSVGCAGTWYFNWIAQMCAPQKHTGIEFYTPRPADLPLNVTWIANTAGSMPEISDGSTDLLFSGQNIEHLWPEDIVNFLLESRRVLRDNGLLVIDSPNRRITAKLQWSQPEHTIEFTVEEIQELLQLAGFDVVKKLGIWLCEDPATGEVLPFEDLSAKGSWPLSRRVTEATSQLPSSFIWWFEACKTARMPQVQSIKDRVNEIYGRAWPERLNRLKTIIGREYQRDGEAWFNSDSKGGALLYGPYAPLLAGRYTVIFSLLLSDSVRETKGCIAVCDVIASNGETRLACCEIQAHDTSLNEVISFPLDFSLEETTFGVQFRVIAQEGIALSVKKAVTLKTL